MINQRHVNLVDKTTALLDETRQVVIGLHQDLDGLRAEIDGLRAEVRMPMAAITELRRDLDQLAARVAALEHRPTAHAAD
jgi:uncharacterized coiled-coil DUF342 family protein